MSILVAAFGPIDQPFAAQLACSISALLEEVAETKKHSSITLNHGYMYGSPQHLNMQTHRSIPKHTVSAFLGSTAVDVRGFPNNRLPLLWVDIGVPCSFKFLFAE